MTAAVAPLTIYYDASCPLCAEEMQALAEADRGANLILVDCSAAGFSDPATASAGLTADLLMRRMHARDAAGKWHCGVDAFVLAYRVVGIERIARSFEHPGLRPLWERLYPWIAQHRTGLSRLRLHRAFGWLVRRAARAAARRSSACSGAGSDSGSGSGSGSRSGSGSGTSCAR